MLTNEKLQALGHEARVDHRSLEAQGIELEPTVHLSPAVIGTQREVEHIHRSIIELSTDIRAALAARDTGQSIGHP